MLISDSGHSSYLVEWILHTLIYYLIPIGITVLLIRKKKNTLPKITKVLCILFLITYLPLLDMNSLWYFNLRLFWPQDYVPYEIAKHMFFGQAEYQFLDFLYDTLNLISQYLLVTCCILFVYNLLSSTNLNVQKWKRVLCYVPIANLFLLIPIVSKYVGKNGIQQILSFTLLLISGLWIYYKHISFFLFQMGIDSISYITQIFFGVPNQNPLVMDEIIAEPIQAYGLASDTLCFFVPMLIYFSGILAVPVITRINSKLKNESKPKLSLPSNPDTLK